MSDPLCICGHRQSHHLNATDACGGAIIFGCECRSFREHVSTDGDMVGRPVRDEPKPAPGFIVLAQMDGYVAIHAAPDDIKYWPTERQAIAATHAIYAVEHGYAPAPAAVFKAMEVLHAGWSRERNMDNWIDCANELRGTLRQAYDILAAAERPDAGAVLDAEYERRAAEWPKPHGRDSYREGYLDGLDIASRLVRGLVAAERPAVEISARIDLTDVEVARLEELLASPPAANPKLRALFAKAAAERLPVDEVVITGDDWAIASVNGVRLCADCANAVAGATERKRAATERPDASLTAEESARFAAAVANPPTPGPALVDAMASLAAAKRPAVDVSEVREHIENRIRELDGTAYPFVGLPQLREWAAALAAPKRPAPPATWMAVNDALLQAANDAFVMRGPKGDYFAVPASQVDAVREMVVGIIDAAERPQDTPKSAEVEQLRAALLSIEQELMDYRADTDASPDPRVSRAYHQAKWALGEPGKRPEDAATPADGAVPDIEKARRILGDALERPSVRPSRQVYVEALDAERPQDAALLDAVNVLRWTPCDRPLSNLTACGHCNACYARDIAWYVLRDTKRSTNIGEWNHQFRVSHDTLRSAAEPLSHDTVCIMLYNAVVATFSGAESWSPLSHLRSDVVARWSNNVARALKGSSDFIHGDAPRSAEPARLRAMARWVESNTFVEACHPRETDRAALARMLREIADGERDVPWMSEPAAGGLRDEKWHLARAQLLIDRMLHEHTVTQKWPCFSRETEIEIRSIQREQSFGVHAKDRALVEEPAAAGDAAMVELANELREGHRGTCRKYGKRGSFPCPACAVGSGEPAAGERARIDVGPLRRWLGKGAQDGDTYPMDHGMVVDIVAMVDGAAGERGEVERLRDALRDIWYITGPGDDDTRVHQIATAALQSKGSDNNGG